MKEIPIIFQPAMVLGLIREDQRPGTGKTETRRFPEKWKDAKLGDHLWVKETYYRFGRWETTGLTNKKGDPTWQFAGTPKIFYLDEFDEANKAKARTDTGFHMRPSIFMPRVFSRFTLTIDALSTERLHDIDETEAIAEGAIWHDGGSSGVSGYRHDRTDGYVFTSAVKSYARLWEQINGKGSWAENPTVVAIKFTVRRTIPAKGKKR